MSRRRRNMFDIVAWTQPVETTFSSSSPFSLHNKSNEITSLWPVLILSHTYTSNVCNDMRCFIETKQNQPTSWNKDIPVLSTTHLQAFKPKRSIDNQLGTTDQHDSITEDMCVSWNIFNRIHIFASCDVTNASCSFWYESIYDRIESWRSSFD